jgi:hypothetical protein
MRDIDESLFSVLRVITIMMNIDGTVHTAELKWFRQLIGRFSLQPDQIKILERDLHRPPELMPLIQKISVLDREQLLSWLRVAMNIDGKITAEEEKFFESVRPLLESDDLDIKESQQIIARELISQTNRIQNWNELKEAGQYFSKTRFSYWGWNFHTLQSYPFGNRYVFWTLIFFVTVSVIVEILSHFLK